MKILTDVKFLAVLDFDRLDEIQAEIINEDICLRLIDEIDENYEANTGKVIAELWKDKESGILNIPAALVAQHGPFTWGISPEKAVESSVVLEETARMAILSMTINPEVFSIGKELLGKHFLRKHGNNAYYGQKKH